MKKIAIILLFVLLILPAANALVDAKFRILDAETKRPIYMRTPDGEIIYGNILVGQKIIFDASPSNSMYPFEEFRWDFDGDGKWDRIGPSKWAYYSYDKPGIYQASLTAVVRVPTGLDSDYVSHTVIVVEKLYPPIPIVDIEILNISKNNVTVLLNANKSYDEDSYVWLYKWDTDNDGEWDIQGKYPKIKVSFDKNGYYYIRLQVVDYDYMRNNTTKVIKITELNGNINESWKEIELENKLGKEINVSIIINNHDFYNITLDKKEIINISVNPDGLNEMNIMVNGVSKTFLFNITDELNICIGKKIYLKEKSQKTPGFHFIVLAIAILLAIKFRNR